MADYSPLPPSWEYDVDIKRVFFNGSNLTLMDAANNFDNGLNHVNASHRNEEFPEYYERTIYLQAYYDEDDVNGVDYVASMYRNVDETIWNLENPEDDYVPNETYYVDLSSITESGHGVVFNGFPDTAFDFDEEDEEEDEETQQDWMSFDDESHINVMGPYTSGAPLDILLV